MRELKTEEIGIVSGGSIEPGSDGPYWTSLEGDTGTLYLPTVTIVGSTITFADAPTAGFFDWDRDGMYEPWADEMMLYAAGSEDLGLPTSVDVENDSNLSQDEVNQAALDLSTYFVRFSSS